MTMSCVAELPLVSVMMPAYNVDSVIGVAIDSILAQTYLNWELIIVDDGSTDSTREIIASYAARDSRIKPIYSEHVGRGRARNICLQNSSGKYIAVMDSDDFSMADRFERQIQFLEKNEDVGILSGQCCTFSTVPKVDMTKLMSWPTDPEVIATQLNKGRMKILNAGAVIRTSVFTKFGGYRESLLRAQDYEFFRRVCTGGVRFAALSSIVVLYRQPNIIPSKKYYLESELFRHYSHSLLSGSNNSFADWSANSLRFFLTKFYISLKYVYLCAKLRYRYRNVAG